MHKYVSGEWNLHYLFKKVHHSLHHCCYVNVNWQQMKLETTDIDLLKVKSMNLNRTRATRFTDVSTDTDQVIVWTMQNEHWQSLARK